MIDLSDMIEAGYTPDDWEWWDNLGYHAEEY